MFAHHVPILFSLAEHGSLAGPVGYGEQEPPAMYIGGSTGCDLNPIKMRSFFYSS